MRRLFALSPTWLCNFCNEVQARAWGSPSADGAFPEVVKEGFDMADLVLNLGLLGAFGTNVEPTQTVDTGGINVTIGFDAQD